MPEPTSRPDCYACELRVGVPGDTHSECRHPGATVSRGFALLAAAYSAPEDCHEAAIECHEGPGGAAISVAFQLPAVTDGEATWPLKFDPQWLRACSGWRPIPAHAPEPADASV